MPAAYKTPDDALARAETDGWRPLIDERTSFQLRARRIAAERDWTVEFDFAGDAWFYDQCMRDVNYAHSEAELDNFDRPL